MRRALGLAAAVVAAIVLVRLFLAGPAITNEHPTGSTIICFGDSLTAGTGASEDQSYPAQLERLIGRPVVNAGVPGDTTASALERLDRDVLAHSPRIVLITLGGNDLLQEVPAAEAMANLETIIRRIQDRGALVALGGLEVPLRGRDYPAAFRDLASRTGCVFIRNVLADILGKPRLMADHIHPNGDGYAVMARHFHGAIKPYL